MSRPARQHHKTQVFLYQRRQLWAVLALIVVVTIIDSVLLRSNLTVARSVGVGALLFYIAQSAFTYMAYRTTGAQARRLIMLNMYLGQLFKWCITLVGFALIFILIKPIVPLAVFVGYLVMQGVHIGVMWRLGRS